jgi:hypothetical protein
MSELNNIALNLYHDGQFFVAQLKRQQGEAISYAKHIFGEEP